MIDLADKLNPKLKTKLGCRYECKLSMDLDGRRVTPHESMMGHLNHARRGVFCAFQSSALSHIKTRFDEQANILQLLQLTTN
jgi:hypothetical protein